MAMALPLLDNNLPNVSAMPISKAYPIKQQFAECISYANQQGLRTNAGHDLNLHNLADLLALGTVDEVSIGHAFTIECIEQGIDSVVKQYLAICQ